MQAPAWGQGQGDNCPGRELAIRGSRPLSLGCCPKIAGILRRQDQSSSVLGEEMRCGVAQGVLGDTESQAYFFVPLPHPQGVGGVQL